MNKQDIDRIIKDLFDDPLSDTELDEPPVNPFLQKDLNIEEDLLALSLTITKKQKPKRVYSDNHDNCSACLGTGKLICCDSCPRVFHIECLDSYTESAFWQCKQCRHQKKKYGKGLFDELIDRMDGTNPKSFILPREIRDYSEFVFTHPLTGEYIDSRDVLISFKKRKRKNKLDSDSLDVDVNDQLDLTVKSLDQPFPGIAAIPSASSSQKESQVPVDQKNGVSVENGSCKLVATSSHNLCSLDTHEKEKKIGLCYKCSKSDLKINQTSFINSHSFSYPLFSNLQTQRSEIIQCDYCFQYWHLDCLSPPLSTVPHQKTQKKQVDLVHVQQLKEKLWNKSFDKQLTSDLKKIDEAASEYKILEIREKWKCPLHTDFVYQVDGAADAIIDSDDTVELLEDTLSLDSNIVDLEVEEKPANVEVADNNKNKRPLFILHYKKEADVRYPKRQRKDLFMQKRKFNRKNVPKDTMEKKITVKTEQVVKRDNKNQKNDTEAERKMPTRATRTRPKEDSIPLDNVKTEKKITKPTIKNANVVVINDEKTIAHYTPQQTIYLSEPKIQLEFINKIQKFTILPPLSEKFREFEPINSNIDELAEYSDGDFETNNEIVNGLVESCPNDKKDVAASLLLMQLGLRNRYIKKYLNE